MSEKLKIDHSIPDGFSRFPSGSPFDEYLGGIYFKEEKGSIVVGFRVQQHHLNDGGTLHGGVIATLADWQLETIRDQLNMLPDARTPTISLSVEYLAPSAGGAWLECRGELQKRTGRMAFTRAEIFSDDQLIARTSAIYHLSRKEIK